ncbi:MAG: hydroxymethylbilane synthase [Deltaproteobacteria bacterium]|nr:hydroxymethylbilane synthase [Deltaproteobacteria bacterium]MBW2387483.1 hydroxymethylbilane synthase [Deltaproteobacteria bacterium]MBW2723635.1 hydroxymethylbilane synthase [Deltaproteobacteria bacterium]
MSSIRIATRGSDLALAQARFVAGLIQKELGSETELLIIKTTGDAIQDIPLAEIGGKGLFVKEIEEALLDGRADVAVHSAKDLPAELASGLTLAAFPERVDPRDALVSRDRSLTLETLPKSARVGTGSTRRSALLLAFRPDLEIVPLRGNVPTRIGKLESDNLDAVILACAGLERLGLQDQICERISDEIMLPAVCQGTLALETRKDDSLAREIARLDDPAVAVAVAGERGFLRQIEGDCTVPMAVHLTHRSDDRVWLRGLVASLDGQQVVRAEEEVASSEAAAAGRRIAEVILDRGGAEILRELQSDR